MSDCEHGDDCALAAPSNKLWRAAGADSNANAINVAATKGSLNRRMSKHSLHEVSASVRGLRLARYETESQ
jgi:hypothetical protein